MKTLRIFRFVPIIALVFLSFSPGTGNVEMKLREWRKGVWLLPDGSFTVYTNSHYFVLVAGGDSATQNVYCGASQVRYHAKGMARKQVLRIRRVPGGESTFYKKNVFQSDGTEAPMDIDASLFSPGICNVKDGIIYDSITEVTDAYILLSTCNGDKEKIFSNGVSVYIPAGGGEAYAYRIESIE